VGHVFGSSDEIKAY